ncbi:MAG: HD domain-containing phosphohydrolase [Fervidobacterium sp.]|uniref:HD domain-containing phosphohydrolase n=1 Tax=Fervidobacterium sp. TaxID=1871331 RepID=UPI00404BA07E
MKSLMKEIKSNKVFLSIVVSFLTFMIVLVLMHEWFHYRFYQENRKTFSIINEVVAGRSNFEVLLPIMKNYRYDSTIFERKLELYKNNPEMKEEVLSEIRNFSQFVRKVDEEGFKDRLYKTIYLIIFILAVIYIGLFGVYRNYKSILNFANNSTERFQEIANNFYVSKVRELREISFIEELAVQNAIKKINLVQELMEKLRHIPLTANVEDFINQTGSVLCKHFNSQRFSVAFIDYDDKRIIAETAYFTNPVVDIKLGPGFAQRFSESSLSEMIINGIRSRIIRDFEERYRNTESPSLRLLLEEGFRSNLTVIASTNSKPFGFFFITSKEKNNYSEDDARLFESISEFLSYRLFYAINLQKVLSEFGHSLSDLVEFKDNETGNHIKRVSQYAKLISIKMNLPPKLTRILYDFAPLHDIGKVGIPDSILLKPGRLDPDEWKIMKTHVDIGVQVIDKFSEKVRGIVDEETLQSIRNILLDHHERWDGKGYPNGKRGEEISIEGRIISIADVFDALTTKRPYKEPIPFEEAVNMILSEKGKHFDPVVVDAFVSCLEQIRNVYERLKD